LPKNSKNYIHISLSHRALKTKMEKKAFKFLELKTKSIITDVYESKRSSSKLQKGACIDPFVAAIASFLTWWFLEEDF
jgi:hypothetical protein